MDIVTFAKAAELSKKIDSYQTILKDLNDPHTKVELSLLVCRDKYLEPKKIPTSIESSLIETLKTELLIKLEHYKKSFDSL